MSSNLVHQIAFGTISLPDGVQLTKGDVVRRGEGPLTESDFDLFLAEGRIAPISVEGPSTQVSSVDLSDAPRSPEPSDPAALIGHQLGMSPDEVRAQLRRLSEAAGREQVQGMQGQTDGAPADPIQGMQGQSEAILKVVQDNADAIKEEIVPRGKWQRDPASLEGLELQDLLIAVVEIDPDTNIEGMDEDSARALLSSDFRPVFQEAAAPAVEGSPVEEAARAAGSAAQPDPQ